ncbi:MAG: diguanylate cyclase [Magnetococcales bacterium]|nr:diguanylate cyclase [Magnetococcales bacterium]
MSMVMTADFVRVIQIMILIVVGLLFWREGRQRPHLHRSSWTLLLVGLVLLCGHSGIELTEHEAQEQGEGQISLAQLMELLGLGLLLAGLFSWLRGSTSLREVERFSNAMTMALARLEINHQELHDKFQRLFAVSESAQDAIIACDATGSIVFWNYGAVQLFGYTSDQAIGQPVTRLIPTRYHDAHQAAMQRAAETGVLKQVAGSRFDLHGLTREGREIPVETAVSTWTTDQERFFVAVMRDVSDRKQQEAHNMRVQQSRNAISALLQMALEPTSLLEQLEQALHIILNVPWLTIESKGSIFLVDEETQELVLTVERGLATHLLTACARIPFGHCLCGRAAQSGQMVYSAHLDERHDVTFNGIKPHGHYCMPIHSRGKLLGVINLYIADGHRCDEEETAFLQAIANTLAGMIERKGVEQQLEHLAYHDALTGLPNRKLLMSRLQRDVARAKREQLLLAVLFLDLDRFKAVNDTMGHEVGDRLLVEVSQRLQSCLREVDTVARLGGDEFTVILSVLHHREDALKVAHKIIAALTEPFFIGDHTCNIGTSVGISFFPQHADQPEDLIKKADVAMYAVKQRGRNSCLVFDSDGMGTTELQS